MDPRELITPSTPRLTEEQLLRLCRRGLIWCLNSSKTDESKTQISDWLTQLEELIAVRSENTNGWPIFLAEQIGKDEDASILLFNKKAVFSKDWLTSCRNVMRKFTFREETAK